MQLQTPNLFNSLTIPLHLRSSAAKSVAAGGCLTCWWLHNIHRKSHLLAILIPTADTNGAWGAWRKNVRPENNAREQSGMSTMRGCGAGDKCGGLKAFFKNLLSKIANGILLLSVPNARLSQEPA